MGLDITAYRKLTRVADPKMEDGCPVDWANRFHAHPASFDFTEENWPGRTDGIERGAVYTFAESFGFRAGSYSGYGTWRKWLSAFAGNTNIEAAWRNDSGLFHELINFTDNEGVIGSVVAANLAKNFIDNQKRAEAYDPGEDRDWWLKQYNNWRRAFEMAADNGAVKFH